MTTNSMHMSPQTKKLVTEKVLTVEELSAFTGIKRSTLLQQAHRGKIDYVKKGNQLLFDKRDFRPDITTVKRTL